MTKYLYLYSRGHCSASERAVRAQRTMWMSYFGELGSALIDYGAPLIPTSQLLAGAKASHAIGFSIVQAETLEQAVVLTAGHPHLRSGGGIEVFEYMPMHPADGGELSHMPTPVATL